MAREFQRGHKAKISDLTAGTDLYVGVQIAGPGLTFDISCFGLDADERLSDDQYFVFFNQPKSPEESIQLLGAQAGDSESFRITPLLPSSFRAGREFPLPQSGAQHLPESVLKAM